MNRNGANRSPSREQLMHWLTHCARLLTVGQVAELDAGAPMRQLVAHQVAMQQRVYCAPLLTLRAPLASWSPGAPPPDFAELSYYARIRWKEPARWTVAYVATRRGARIFGGRGGPLKNPLQATHDVHVTEILLVLWRTDPVRAAGWIGEDVMGQLLEFSRGRRPDAVLVNRSGKLQRAIEFVGSYPAERIASFHRQCAQPGWEYDLW